MKLALVMLLLLAGCADSGGGEDGSVHARVNGAYTTFGAAALHH